MVYGILENPINRETALRAAEPAQKVTSAEGHLVSLCCPRDRFFVKTKCGGRRKTIMKYYTGSPLLCEPSTRRLQREAHCQPLESLSLSSQETLSWWHPKMSAPAQVFPIHAALRTTRARVCPPCSTCRSSSMAFLIPLCPLMSIV